MKLALLVLLTWTLCAAFTGTFQEWKSRYQKIKGNLSMKFALVVLSTWTLCATFTGMCALFLVAYVR